MAAEEEPQRTPRVIHLATPSKRPPRSGGGSGSASASSTTAASGSREGRGSQPRGLANILDGAASPAGAANVDRTRGDLDVALRQVVVPALHLPLASPKAHLVDEASDTESDYSPRLPEEWQPLEYELLEYADALPPGFACRVGKELEVQERTVAQLRALNALLLRQEAAVAGATAAGSEAGTSAEAAAVAGLAREAAAGGGCAAAAAEAKRRAELEESAKQLDAQTHQVRREAEKAMGELTTRVRAAEETQRQLARESAEDAGDRKRLWEAEADLLRLCCKKQQREAGLRHSERRAAQREDEDRQTEGDLAHLHNEATSYRIRVAEYEGMNLDAHEEELRQALRDAKAEVRAKQKNIAAAAPSKDSASPPRASGARSPLITRRSLGGAGGIGGGVPGARAGGAAATSPRSLAPGAGGGKTSPRQAEAKRQQPPAAAKGKTSPRVSLQQIAG